MEMMPAIPHQEVSKVARAIEPPSCSGFHKNGGTMTPPITIDVADQNPMVFLSSV
jgi:hypothetical protein